MAAITNFGTLKTAVADWLDRSDLSGVIPDFVTFATALFNYGAAESQTPALRCREMEVVDDLTPSSGVCALPSDYLQYRRVVEKSSPRRNLEFITPDQAEAFYPSRTSGPANHFTIIGSSLYTFPLASNDIELTYYGALTALSSDSDTNWLLTKNPQVYLRAAMVAAHDYLGEDGPLAKRMAQHNAFVAGMNHNSLMATYARAGLSMRTPMP